MEVGGDLALPTDEAQGEFLISSIMLGKMSLFPRITPVPAMASSSTPANAVWFRVKS